MLRKKKTSFPLKKKKKKSRLDCDTQKQIMVDTGTKELAKKLTFAAVGDVTTDDDDVFFFSNNVEKEDAEKKRAASIARAKEDPKAQSLRR